MNRQEEVKVNQPRCYFTANTIQNQSGQGLIEYLILVALIAVATIGAIRVVGESLDVKLANVAKSLGAEVQGDIGKARVTDKIWKKKDMRDFMTGSMGRGSGSSGGEAQDDSD
jgi:pilus assembly protein Flp/PilA